MSAVATMRETASAGETASIRADLDAHRVLEPHTGGTLVVRTDGMACRALEEAGHIAAFTLWNGPGM